MTTEQAWQIDKLTEITDYLREAGAEDDQLVDKPGLRGMASYYRGRRDGSQMAAEIVENLLTELSQRAGLIKAQEVDG